MDRVKGKVAVVTGGAMGIGKAGCILLAREGAKVAVTDMNPAGEKVAAEIRAFGGTSEFWQMNTANEKEVAQTFKEIAAKFGKINVLVNNAGVLGTDKPTDQVTEAEWDKVMNTDVKGLFFCTKHAMPYMKKAKGGSSINLSSIYGLVEAADAPPYHAAKGAVRLMAKNDATLYARDNIRVNSIHPGAIWTPMVQALAREAGGRKEFEKSMVPKHPLGHLGEPDDIGWGIALYAFIERMTDTMAVSAT